MNPQHAKPPKRIRKPRILTEAQQVKQNGRY